VDYRDIVKPDKKKRTYEYWDEVYQTVHEGYLHVQNGTKEEVLKDAASLIDKLPTRGVDEEAIDCVQDIAAALLKKAEFLETNGGAARAPEAFIRGMLGDPFGVAGEVSDEAKAVDRRFGEIRAKAKKTRAILSSRYDKEFPGLE
jgi:hypothetical protein